MLRWLCNDDDDDDDDDDVKKKNFQKHKNRKKLPL